MCNFVFPLTTIGKIDVFSISSVELKVSVMVFKAGVAAVELARTITGKVSIELDKSVSARVNSGPDEVKMFSGAGIVSVWNRGLEEVGAIVGLKVSVKVLEMKIL